MPVRIRFAHVAKEDKGSMVMKLLRALRSEQAAKTRKLPPIKNAKEAKIARGVKRTHGGGADN